MKFLSVLFALFFAVSANAFIGNIGHSTNLDYSGAVVAESVEKIFINVKANGAIAAGMWAALDLTADNGATVIPGPVSNLAPLCVMVAACADGKLCSCQTYGLGEVLYSSTDGSAVAGHKMVAASGNIGYIAARATDLAIEPSLGYFYDAATVSGTVQAFIKI